MPDQWNDKVFGINKEGFEALALGVFRFQYDHNPLYKAYTDALRVDPDRVDHLDKIPFLPIRFFKSHAVQTTSFEPAAVFESSGTTGNINSRHLIKDLTLYEESFTKGFELFYGPIKEWCIIGLLPSYLERKHSSLVYMVDRLITLSEHPQSDFYLNEYEKLFRVLGELERRQQKTLLLGVTFALLDMTEKFSPDSQLPVGIHGRDPLPFTTLMETGGMKGRRKEMIREEVHEILKKAFGLPAIHSEYGMTELLSQAYSSGAGIFNCPPWMKVMLRDEGDPLDVQSGSRQSAVGQSAVGQSAVGQSAVGQSFVQTGHALSVQESRLSAITGAINIIDLANIYSCSFIATDDAGKLYPDGSFEVLGRMDGSDLRGCSLMTV